MDQDAFRTTYHEVNEQFCAFEKSILTNQCTCSQAERFCIAEREGVHCNSQEGQKRCLELQEHLREQARFALRTDNATRKTLPHGKAIRIQVGGMRGIYKAVMESGWPEIIPDIDHLLQLTLQKFSTFGNLPFSSIMQEISAYEIRKRSRRHQRKNKP